MSGWIFGTLVLLVLVLGAGMYGAVRRLKSYRTRAEQAERRADQAEGNIAELDRQRKMEQNARLQLETAELDARSKLARIMAIKGVAELVTAANGMFP